MAQLKEDEWPREQEPTTQEQQIPAVPADADGPVIGHDPGSPNAERERRHIAREPKRPGNDAARGRSGPGLDDADRRRTRDGATSGEWQSGVAEE